MAIKAATAFVVGLGLALPALAQPSGMPSGTITCNQTAIYDASTINLTKMITGVAGKVTYICGYAIDAGAATNVGLASGTGTNCGTNTVKLTPYYSLGAASMPVVDVTVFWRGIQVPALTDLCINSSAGVAVQAIVYFGQY